ncbi:MAG: transcriptional regulator [Treponema sp.]|nr:transcriptional regulator [Treponema sp.]
MILVMTIVPHSYGETITSAATEKGATGGTILMGRGTASNSFIQMLGLGDSSKDITYSIVEEQILDDVKQNIINACSGKKAHFGVMFCIKMQTFIKSGNIDKSYKRSKDGEIKMDYSYQIINVIVNKGYADEAMAAARKAGAGGGTIIQAHGTAKEGDVKFFGTEIVPEKDFLMILVPSDKKTQILEAIKNLECLKKAGSGIIFCNEVQDFTLLGKNNI